MAAKEAFFCREIAIDLIYSVVFKVYLSFVFILPKQIVGYWNKNLIDSFGLDLIL
jgi:hypothetical protein